MSGQVKIFSWDTRDCFLPVQSHSLEDINGEVPDHIGVSDMTPELLGRVREPEVEISACGRQLLDPGHRQLHELFLPQLKALVSVLSDVAHQETMLVLVQRHSPILVVLGRDSDERKLLFPFSDILK